MKNKKPFYKRLWFWILLVIIGLLGLSSSNDTKNTTNNVNTTSIIETSSNIQENTIVNNQSEENSIDTEKELEENTTKIDNEIEETVKAEEIKNDYVVNKNTKVFHNYGCSSISKMKEKNKKEITATRDEMIKKGYKPCGICNP